MRRVAKISAACAATAALALTATACGSTSSDNNASSSASSGGGKGIKIGLAYDVGGRGDRSFNDSAARGADKAKSEFGGSIKELTAKTSDTEADREQRLSDLADAGYNPIVAVGFSYAPAVTKIAAKYPKTSFGIVDSVVNAKNVDSITFTEEQGSYLAGVAAALKTKKDHVGFIGGVDVPLIKKFEAGYVQGVHDTNPKVKVQVQYLSHGSDTSGFSSPDKGKEAAQGMLDNGADVIYSAMRLLRQRCDRGRARRQGRVGHRCGLRPVQHPGSGPVQELDPDLHGQERRRRRVRLHQVRPRRQAAGRPQHLLARQERRLAVHQRRLHQRHPAQAGRREEEDRRRPDQGQDDPVTRPVRPTADQAVRTHRRT